LTDVRQVVVALYPLDDARYTPLSVVYLANDVPLARLKEIWNVSENAEPSDIYSNAATSFLAKTSPRAADKIEAFVMGPKNLVEQAADYKAINSLDGSLGELAHRVDASRHFTAMILPSALFNQQGQELVGKLWEPVNRQARILTDDHIRGVLFSAHFEAEQSYWELTVDHTADVKNQALVDSLKKSFADAQSMIVDAAAFLPGDSYWNRVRLRLDNMFDGFVRNSRFGAESGFVIVNSWVPATAVHNLLKASDLAVRMNGTSPIAAAAKPVAPQSLAQLLAIKRDLKVTTNPDLNVLLQNLVTEVKDSHPGLPFEFRIELIGNDLVGEGITQNQRPGDFELKDATLASILTEIVVRANPDKSATGPADPKCKLVWVIADEPQKPGAKIIQITTRAAAEAKSLELPQAFRVEQP
jgi:eukaryotic-like serine/threonine-protein kinase